MRKLTLLVALIASTSAGWAQQRLPGPAGDGWYVLIGASPISQDMKNGGFPWPVCKAMIVPADYRADVRNPLLTTRGHQDLPDYATEPKRYGPFESKFHAEQALERSGWNLNRSNVVFSDAGCDNAAELLKQRAVDVQKAFARQEAERAQREQEAREKIQREQAARQAPAAPNLAAVVTASEIEGLRSKIRPCWNTIGGGREQNMVITLVIQMNQDGTPVKAELKDTGRYNNDPNFRAAADAAHRAIMNPRCQPWPLSPEKYKSWRNFTFNFDPRDY